MCCSVIAAGAPPIEGLREGTIRHDTYSCADRRVRRPHDLVSNPVALKGWFVHKGNYNQRTRAGLMPYSKLAGLPCL